MKNLILVTYIVYLPIALLMTIVVAKTFYRNSKIFMLDIFKGRQDIADNTNQLFRMGFYLLCLGYALFILRVQYYGQYYDSQKMFETLSSKIGALSVFLGIMVFLNLFLLFRGKRKSSQSKSLFEPRLKP